MTAHAHIPRVRTFVLVWLALICLTGMTTGVSYVELGWMNIVIALFIAVFKASMGVCHTTNLTKLFVVAGLVWLSILILVTFSDYTSRSWTYQPQPWSQGPG